jgi:hypothetical protein
MLSVVTHLLKSPIARLKPSLMRNLVSGQLNSVSCVAKPVDFGWGGGVVDASHSIEQ